MNILAVWTLFIEHPFYNPTKDCEHTSCWTCGWGKHSVSISLTLSPCPDIAPHSSLFFTLQLFCSAGWKGGWKLVCLPLWQNEANLLEPAVHWSHLLPPAPLRAKGGQACVSVWLEAASSTWTSTWLWMDYRVGGKLPELSGWKSCDQQLKVQDLSLRDPWQGQHSSLSSPMTWTMGHSVLPAGSQVPPNWRAQCHSWRNDTAQTSQSSTKAT